MIGKWVRERNVVKKLTKTPTYVRLRQRLPTPSVRWSDDRGSLPEAEVVTIDWPAEVKKPLVGILQDYEPYPRWTKFCRFLENNAIPYTLFDIHGIDWLERARKIDVFVGILSSEAYLLQEVRQKYFVLQKYLGKMCFPSFEHMFLYEDKTLEAFICAAAGLPYAPTHIFFSQREAAEAVRELHYPQISKIDPGSGSIGVQLVRGPKKAAAIINAAFSARGRATQWPYSRQKNYVYFQDYMPNDGYDIRVILVNRWAFGYYRKVLKGDFRASGMNTVEKRALPADAVRTAWQVNQVIRSPLLVVDMVHGLDDRYYVIEFGPVCQMELPEQLHVNGVPGVYIIEENGAIRFQAGKYWVHEIALREFLLNTYLPAVQPKGTCP